MCKLTEHVDLKSVTVYKVCCKHKGNYYSYFAGFKIKKGPVIFEEPEDLDYFDFIDYSRADRYYCDLMVGRCSGFRYLKDALVYQDLMYHDRPVILKIILTGSIVKGTADNMGYIPKNTIIYAGSEIKSFKEYIK